MIRTSLPKEPLEAEKAVLAYKRLAKVEGAFRDLMSSLDLRPVYHQKEIRVETHLFLTVLAHHLQAAIERTVKPAWESRSWETQREELGTHHVLTTLLPTPDGQALAIRQGGVPDRRVAEIYRHLDQDPEPMAAVRTWL